MNAVIEIISIHKDTAPYVIRVLPEKFRNPLSDTDFLITRLSGDSQIFMIKFT